MQQKCMKCKQMIDLNSLNTAIFSNCRYDLNLCINGEIKPISGIVGYQDGYKTFNEGHSEVNGIIGRIYPLTNIEKIAIEFVDYLWEHDF